MKKSQIQTNITTILLFLVIAVILIILAGKITSILQESRAREVCRASIVAAAKTHLKPLGVTVKESPISIKCKTFFLDFKDDGIYKNQKRIKKFDSTTNLEEEVKRAIADEMYDCWKQVKDVAQMNMSPFGGLFPNNKCILCTRVNFHEDFTEKLQGINNFNQWLRDNEPLGSTTTYEEFFGREIPGINNIKTEGSYYILDSFARGDRWTSLLKQTAVATPTAAITGGIGGAVLGAVGGMVVGGLIGGPLGALGGLAYGTIAGAKGGLLIGGVAGATWGLSAKTIYTSMMIATPREGVENFCQEIYS